MAKKKANLSVPSIRDLAAKSGITYTRLYDILTEKYNNTLTPDENRRLANALYDGNAEFLKFLGFRMELHRIQKPT